MDVHQVIVVTAKCSACKHKQDYTMPINYTPWCPNCHKLPMFPVKSKITTYLGKEKLTVEVIKHPKYAS
jgi:hypothetical protein